MTDTTNPTLSPCDAFCDLIHSEVAEQLPMLDPEGEYLTEQLCGKVFWELIGDGMHRLAGKCIRKLAEQGILPLVIVIKRHEYPLVFAIIK